MLVALAMPATAVASLFLELEPPSGPPGTSVQGVTVGRGSVSLAAASTLDAYLAPAGAAPVATDDPSLTPIGGLVVDAAGDGRIEFRIPAVAPGPVSVYVFCPPCAPSSAGRTLLWVADFLVTVDAPATDVAVDYGGGTSPGFALVGTAMVAIGLGLMFVLRRWGGRR
jgi:hypothetical protein